MVYSVVEVTLFGFTHKLVAWKLFHMSMRNRTLDEELAHVRLRYYRGHVEIYFIQH